MSNVDELSNELAEVAIQDGPAIDEKASDPKEFARLVQIMQKDANEEAVEDSPAHHALVRMRKALSREQQPPVREAIEAGSIPVLCELARRDDVPSVQFEALWALTNIASGNSEDTQAVVEGGAAGIAVNCLGMPTEAVREQATWLIGNISGDSVQMRDTLLEMGVVDPLVVNMERLDGNAQISVLRNTVWTVSNLCRGKPQPPFEHVVAFVNPLIRLLHMDDAEVLTDACWALSYITDGPNERIQPLVDAGGIPRILLMMQHASEQVQTPALRTIGNVVTGDDRQTQAALDAGLLPTLLGLMGSPRKSICKEACWAVSNITAGTSEQIQSVLDANLLPALLHILTNGEGAVRKEALWAVANATSGGRPAQIQFIVSQGVIPAMVQALKVFDNGNNVVQVGLESFDKILQHGQRLQEQQGANGNAFAELMEEAGAVDLIEAYQDGNAPDNVQQMAVSLLEKYFEVEEEEAEVPVAPMLGEPDAPASGKPGNDTDSDDDDLVG